MRRKPRKIYHAYRGKSRWKRWAWVLAAAGVIALAVLAAWLLAGGKLPLLP